MNAIIRKKCEAPVLTNEAIEVHLTYLRSGLDAVQSALPVLRDKIDQLSVTVETKFEKATARIEAVNTSLSEKIDEINITLGEKIVAGDTALGQKDRQARRQGFQTIRRRRGGSWISQSAFLGDQYRRHSGRGDLDRTRF
jgi:hypothetical protein